LAEGEAVPKEGLTYPEELAPCCVEGLEKPGRVTSFWRGGRVAPYDPVPGRPTGSRYEPPRGSVFWSDGFSYPDEELGPIRKIPPPFLSHVLREIPDRWKLPRYVKPREKEKLLPAPNANLAKAGDESNGIKASSDTRNTTTKARIAGLLVLPRSVFLFAVICDHSLLRCEAVSLP
jgi:hypothetical protein